MKRFAKFRGISGHHLAAGSLMAVLALSACSAFETTAPPSAQAGDPDATSGSVQGEPTAAVALRRVDGGTDYYSRFAHSLPSTSGFFPVGIWLESVIHDVDVKKDQSVGINTYVSLTPDSDLGLVKAHGQHALTSQSPDQAAGLVLPDEADMWAGAGDAKWSGNYPGEGPICEPDGAKCGYTVHRTILKGKPNNQLVYANYGKGVTFKQSPAEASVFINEFPNVASADNYWFTDPFICAANEGGSKLKPVRDLGPSECRLAANYGWTVDRVRSFVRPASSKPVWAFVEVGHPFKEDSGTSITGPEIRAAVWSSIIHGARGIVYFNHSFGGDCPTQHVLRTACGDQVRPWVTAVNKQIKSLAPVLNAPFVDNAVSRTGRVDTAVKLYKGKMYVLAGSAQPKNQKVTFTLKCAKGTKVTVLDENRTLTMKSGKFTDRFKDGNAVHIYRIDGGTSCKF